MRRALRGAALGAALAAATLVAAYGLLFYRPLPTTDGYFRLLGLHERVEVIRDALGVPHLYASDDHDLWFLQGYVTAQDRLAQLEALRRTARARSGEGARAALARAPAPLRAALDAYAAGVTKLVDQYAAARALPGELVLAGIRPAPWEPADTLAIVAAYVERLDASSVCASAAATRTRKGAPIVAAEIGAPLPDPGWYEVGLEMSGLRAAGISLPGVPGIVAGHNGWVAWSVLPSARVASDPNATLGGLLAAMPSHSARTFADALRGSAVATCLADVAGNVGGTDRGQLSFVPAEHPGVIGGEARVAAIGARLDPLRGVDIEAMRVLLGPPAPEAGARVIVDLADVDTSRSAVSRGASGQRSGRHYADQAPLWELGQMHRLALSRSRIGVMDGDLTLRAR